MTANDRNRSSDARTRNDRPPNDRRADDRPKDDRNIGNATGPSDSGGIDEREIPLDISRTVDHPDVDERVEGFQRIIGPGAGGPIDQPDEELIVLNMERALKEAQFINLQDQIRPHFLFNALNTISAVIRNDPERARQLVQNLSTFFRKNLKRPSQMATLADEVERGWSGRFIEGEGYVFERTVRGVKDVAVIDAALLSSAEARKLDEYAARLQEAYPRSAILRRKDSETPIHGPVSLFEAVIEAGRKGVTYQRYKGLGEMNPDQLWETTLDVNARSLLQVKIREVDAADDIFTKLMGDVVEPRREFIQDNSLQANVDV